MTKNILLWVWGIVLTLGLIYVGLHAFAPQTFGDSTVSLFPTQYVNGILIGKTGGKQNTVNAIDSGSFVQNAITLATVTSTATSTASITSYSLAVGDACIGANTQITAAKPVLIGGQVVAVSSKVATVLITYVNAYNGSNTVATGTTAFSCFNTPY